MWPLVVVLFTLVESWHEVPAFLELGLLAVAIWLKNGFYSC